MDRRQFVKSAVALAAPAAGRAVGANDRIRVGLIGAGGRGSWVGRKFLRNSDVAIPIIADVNQLNSRKSNTEFLGGKCEIVEDYRRILDRKDIDAILIGTPDHWHAIPTIHACQAGKDVYVEKPMSYAIAEGRRMVQAARKHNRVVQIGCQQVSGAHYQEASRIVQSGGLGKVTHVRAWNFGNRLPGYGFPPDEPAPNTINWDYYVGPAPAMPYHPLKASARFRLFWALSGGIMTDWGAHHAGSVHQIMGVNHPLSAASTGGKLAIHDISEMPDTYSVLWQYPGFTFEFTLHEASSYSADASSYGIVFHGSDAAMFIDRVGFEIFPEKKSVPRKIVGHPRVDIFRSDEADFAHIRNFLDCMRSRKLPIADVEIGHQGVIGPHLANISLRTGRKITWDAETETITGDAAAAEMLSRKVYRAPYLLPEV